MEDAIHANAEARADVADQLAISKAAKQMHAEIEDMVNQRTEEILRATAELIPSGITPEQADEARSRANAEAVPEPEPDVTVKVDLMRYVPLSASDRNVPGIVCTCGLSKYHKRFKVLRTWADNHRNKTGHLFTTKS